MTGDLLSDDDHVSRYCSPRAVRNGRVLPDAFQLRAGEEYLSVNWLESFGRLSRRDAVNRVRTRMTANGFTLRDNGRFAVLRVGAVKRVRPVVGDIELSVEHMPTVDDDSHCGVRGYTEDDEAVAARLAGLLTEDDIHPGRL